MGQQHTKDERFVMCLYENAQKTGDLESSFNRYLIGQQISMQEKGVDAICKLLVQANFVKKDGLDDIYLTVRGVALAERLLDEK